MSKLADITFALRNRFPGRYLFLMIDRRSDQTVLTQSFYTKLHALSCFQFHSKLSPTFIYRVIDVKTNKEIV